MAKYEKTSDGRFRLFNDMGDEYKNPITQRSKEKIGDLNAFVNAAQKNNSKNNAFKSYLEGQAQKLQKHISAFPWYWEVAIFLIKGLNFINFKYLHIVNSEPGYQYIKGDNRDWPRVPIYYRHIYSRTPYYTKYIKSDMEYNMNKNVYTLKYKPNFHYKDGNKISDDKTRKEYLKNERKQIYKCLAYEFFYKDVKDELNKLLSTNHKIAVMDIPSSKAHTETVLDRIIHEISESNSNIINASDLLVRTKTKKTSHNGLGTQNRSVLDNINTLGLSMSSISRKLLDKAEAFVILDDVTTTGSSFIAVDKFIHDNQGENKKLPRIPLINLAYAKTVGNFYCTQDQSDLIKTSGFIKGVVFDIDNTLLDTNNLAKQYHKYMKDNHYVYSIKEFGKILRNLINNNENIKQLMDIIRNLVKQGIKVSYVSNRGYRELNEMLNSMVGSINENGVAYRQILPNNKINQTNSTNPNSSDKFFGSSSLVISASARTDPTDRYSATPKPGSYSINSAIDQMGLSNNDRIIGIGNQESDIIAYKRAGIEPILVNWFNRSVINPYNITKGGKVLYENPVPLINYNGNNITRFDTVDNFNSWLDSQLNNNTTDSDFDLPF